PGGVDFLYEGEHLPTASGRQARAGRNRARAPRANASAESSSGFLTLGSELAIALERAGEMAPHRLARRAGIAAADRLEDTPVLLLDEREVRLPAAHALGQAAHRAPRNEVPADELKKARELGIAGSVGDGAMESEVLVDGRAARSACLFNRIPGIGNAPQLCFRG